MLYIIRNGKQYGPYDENTLINYVYNGTVVKNDVAVDPDTGRTTTVRDHFKRFGVNLKVAHGGDLFSQLGRIGGDLIVPKEAFSQNKWLNDKTLIVLAIVGLFPTLMLVPPMPQIGVFYLMALYFSCIWGLFFYYLFKTPQVKLVTTITLFFITQIFVFVVWNILGLVRFNPFYYLVEAPFPINLLGFVFGVGLSEEIGKMLPLLLINRKSKQPLLPQTLVFYGLMSGIAFGVFEGVQYQITINTQLGYTEAFYSNIARLTSLPFLHAIWCAIAGYFISFANLFPKYRIALYFLAVAIPALLHGLYDTFISISVLVSLLISIVGVLLLMAYLKRGGDYQHRLKQ